MAAPREDVSGRSLRADYKMIARALTRKGNCLVKMGDLEEAINVYQKALTEHRCGGLGLRAM